MLAVRGRLSGLPLTNSQKVCRTPVLPPFLPFIMLGLGSGGVKSCTTDSISVLSC